MGANGFSNTNTIVHDPDLLPLLISLRVSGFGRPPQSGMDSSKQNQNGSRYRHSIEISLRNLWFSHSLDPKPSWPEPENDRRRLLLDHPVPDIA
jgi:hypothetical protein